MYKKVILSIIAIFCTTTTFAQNTPTYPEPKAGYKRVDLIFPKIENDDQYKVEVRFGMETELYPCSNANFGFRPDYLIKEYGIKDGRFPYYDLTSNNAGIFEGFNDDECNKEKKIKRKILSTNTLFLEHNSYYPIPFYIPESYTLEYRLWHTVTDTFTTVEIK